jgi:multiple sugar transport system substrate-binding protein
MRVIYLMGQNDIDNRNNGGLTRRQVIGGAASLLAGGMVGCAPRPSAVREERDGQGRRILHFWNGFTGPDGKTMERMVQRFRDANPDIAVKMQLIPWGTYYDKLTLSLAYGGAPHVCVIHANRLPEFTHYGAVQSLDTLYAASGDRFGESKFAPIPWKATFWEGKQYALPLDVHPACLYYNKTLLREAGISKPPTNWEDFLAAAKAITKPSSDGKLAQWGFVFTWQRTNFVTFAAQFGGNFLTPSLDQAAMSSPECLAAAEAMRSLIYEHHVAPAPEGVDAWLAFRQGKVGMAMEGIYMQSSLEEQKDLDWAAAPVPQFGKQPGVWAGSHLLAQPRGISEEASRDAWKLMCFLSDNSLLWAEGGQVPARNDIRATPEFAHLGAPTEAARQLSYVVYEPPSPRANALFPFVDPAIESVLLNRETPQSAFTDADRRMNQVLKRP